MQGYSVMTVREYPYPYLELIRAHDVQTYRHFILTYSLSIYLVTKYLYSI